LDLLIDTQALVWTISGDSRVTAAVRQVLASESNRFFISAVTAFESHDLELRGRLSTEARFAAVVERLAATILDFPSGAWTLLPELPDLHRDPVDRMLIAHAIHADLTLVTGDATMRLYPVRSLW
jgi:PIN domain nuclease of toxin-antitoxin system